MTQWNGYEIDKFFGENNFRNWICPISNTTIISDIILLLVDILLLRNNNYMVMFATDLIKWNINGDKIKICKVKFIILFWLNMLRNTSEGCTFLHNRALISVL